MKYRPPDSQKPLFLFFVLFVEAVHNHVEQLVLIQMSDRNLGGIDGRQFLLKHMHLSKIQSTCMVSF